MTKINAMSSVVMTQHILRLISDYSVYSDLVEVWIVLMLLLQGYQ